MFVGLFVDLGSTTISSGANMIQTCGYAEIGKGAALYVRDGTSTWSGTANSKRSAAIAASISGATVDAALAATEGKWRKADSNGNYWTLYKGQRILSTMFGAKHDAIYNGNTAWGSRWTGTNDRPAIQAMIDFALYFGGPKEGCLADGKVLLDNTVHIGYGDAFYGGYLLTGLAAPFATLEGGAYFIRNFAGKPLINVQGARSIYLDRFGTYGCIFEYVFDNYLAKPEFTPGVGPTASNPGTDPTIDDTTSSGWHDPAVESAIGHGLDDRYRPDAAITVDAYAGTRPANSYPDAHYPAWLGAASLVQWGKGISRLRTH